MSKAVPFCPKCGGKTGPAYKFDELLREVASRQLTGKSVFCNLCNKDAFKAPQKDRTVSTHKSRILKEGDCFTWGIDTTFQYEVRGLPTAIGTEIVISPSHRSTEQYTIQDCEVCDGKLCSIQVGNESWCLGCMEKDRKLNDDQRLLQAAMAEHDKFSDWGYVVFLAVLFAVILAIVVLIDRLGDIFQ